MSHAARGAQCRECGRDDAGDDLQDRSPRFLFAFHSIRWFLMVIIFGSRGVGHGGVVA